MITTTSPHPSRTILRRRLWLAGCARRVLVEHGYAGLTADRVAWTAGTDAAAVRWTFSDRPTLAVAALTEGLPRFDAGSDGSSSLPALERWSAAVGRRAAPVVAPLEALVDGADVEADVLDEVHRRLVGPTRRALDVVLDDGSTPTERDLLCAATWATAVIGAACHRHVGDVPGLRHVVTFVMRPVPAAPAAALVA